MRSSWLLVVILPLIAGCSSSGTHPVVEVTARADSTGVQHVSITAHSYFFEPNRVILKAGHPVVLEIRNGTFGVPHNLTCNAVEAGMMLTANLNMFHGHTELKFTPTKTGEYEFFCHIGSHAKHGMKGAFVVVP